MIYLEMNANTLKHREYIGKKHSAQRELLDVLAINRTRDEEVARCSQCLGVN